MGQAVPLALPNRSRNPHLLVSQQMLAALTISQRRAEPLGQTGQSKSKGRGGKKRVPKQGWICYTEKKKQGNLNLRDENSNLLVSSSPLLPFAPPFVVSMCFPCSSVEMKNNSSCSVKLCGRNSFRQVVNSDIMPTQGLHLPRKVLKPAVVTCGNSILRCPSRDPLALALWIIPLLWNLPQWTAVVCLILRLLESRAWLFSVFSGSTQVPRRSTAFSVTIPTRKAWH